MKLEVIYLEYVSFLTIRVVLRACFQTLRSPPTPLKKGGENSQSPPFQGGFRGIFPHLTFLGEERKHALVLNG
jgi:hypothetical protein